MTYRVNLFIMVAAASKRIFSSLVAKGLGVKGDFVDKTATFTNEVSTIVSLGITTDLNLEKVYDLIKNTLQEESVACFGWSIRGDDGESRLGAGYFPPQPDTAPIPNGPYRTAGKAN